MQYDLLLDSLHRHIQLDQQEKDLLYTYLDTCRVSSKDFLLRADEVCLYDYFVTKGCLRSFYIDKEGVEHTTMFAVEGWWTGNLKSFVRGTLSGFYLQAMEPTECFRFDKQRMDQLYVEIPQFNRYFRILLQNRLISTQDRVSGHLSFTAKERYLQFRRQYPDLEQRVAQKYIASYLGITPAYLSRMRRRLRNSPDLLT